MGSLEDRAVLQVEGDRLVNSGSTAGKVHSFKLPDGGSDDTNRNAYAGSSSNNGFIESIKIVVFSAKLNILMISGPIAIIVDKTSGSRGWVFLLSLLGITPLAERLGYAIEQLAFFTGPKVGALLNATFGNATELIISILALRKGMMRFVQQSSLGSILSNMLLVLGCAFFCGGLVITKREQVFNKAVSSLNSGLLLMAVMGILFPAVLHATDTELHFGKSELSLSRFISCIMLVAYAAYLHFQLKSQKKLYDQVNENEGMSDDAEAPEISKWASIIWLFTLTALISMLSEFLVDSVEEASSALKIPVAFISVILVPIVEHADTIMYAMRDKLDLSLGVAIGSSTKTAMFVVPLSVVVGWIMGCPMDLNFQLFETATLMITVLVVAFLLQEGTSNYFKGLMLILCYVIVAASFFVHVDPASLCKFSLPFPDYGDDFIYCCLIYNVATWFCISCTYICLTRLIF